MRSAIGGEIRVARVNRNLTLDAVCSAVGVSASTGSRLERGVLEHVDVMLLARMCAVVGLELSIKAFAGGQPIRDAGHLAILRAFRGQLHPSLDWGSEVPLPAPGDPRAWDGLILGNGWRYGVESETAPRDGQATLRRLALKQRDGQVDGVLLILPDTRQSRVFLREISAVMGVTFPIAGPRALELLGVGAAPGGSSIVVLPKNPTGLDRLGYPDLLRTVQDMHPEHVSERTPSVSSGPRPVPAPPATPTDVPPPAGHQSHHPVVGCKN